MLELYYVLGILTGIVGTFAFKEVYKYYTTDWDKVPLSQHFIKANSLDADKVREAMMALRAVDYGIISDDEYTKRMFELNLNAREQEAFLSEVFGEQTK